MGEKDFVKQERKRIIWETVLKESKSGCVNEKDYNKLIDSENIHEKDYNKLICTFHVRGLIKPLPGARCVLAYALIS
jgi:hypothetical protein